MSMYIPFMTDGMITVVLIRLPYYYNYKRMKYEALVVSDEKVGDKEIQIL